MSIDLKLLLEEKYDLYNRKNFIETDPVSIPHLFDKKEDIEIAGFFAATIAWGQRKTILSNAGKLMKIMEYSPFDFIMNYKKPSKAILSFTHRTFNGIDCDTFIKAIQNTYKHHKGLEGIFTPAYPNEDLQIIISRARKIFFDIPHQSRTLKHFSDPLAGSAAKRINMYLRWMIRKDKRGVDFGIWNQLSPAQLICPLDVHSGNVARKLGLLMRKQNDWQAAYELTLKLKEFDPEDPVKYDFALFGLGAFEKF
jgi:uncharacterized protein (TIGR02757 family)